MRIFGKYELDPTFHFHLRCAAWITFVAAIVTLVGAMYFRFDRYDRLIDETRAGAADNARLQAQLSRLRSQDAAERALVEDRLRTLSEQQTAADAVSKNAASRSPFSIATVLPSLTEIVCIDNKHADTYYTGSGTVFSKEGLILTNHHLLVSQNGSLIKLCGVGFTSDARIAPRIQYAAQVEALDEAGDLAVLRITENLDKKPLPASFPALDLTGIKEASLGLGIGDPVFIGGYPGIGAETFTFTQGVVSGRVGSQLIKTSALIDSGTSGGAVFDASGQYVGVPTAAAKGDIGGSLGFLISGEAVDNFLHSYYNGLNRVPGSR
ncbi:MAG: hypothetical protein RLZZ324_583 [Candidatus Parcubacteria bacterium]|jgi:S1-C subfamily serine protease